MMIPVRTNFKVFKFVFKTINLVRYTCGRLRIEAHISSLCEPFIRHVLNYYTVSVCVLKGRGREEYLKVVYCGEYH